MFVKLISVTSKFSTSSHRIVVLVSNFLFCILLGAIDYISSNQFSFSIFYLIPIVIVTLIGKRSDGIVFSMIAAVTWLRVDLSTTIYSNSIAPYWNASVRFIFFLIVVFSISKIKDLYSSLEIKIEERTSDLKREIIERKKIENELRESQEMYRNLLESITEFFYITDNFGIIKYCSANFLHVLGLSLDKVLGKSIYRFIFQADRRRVLSFSKSEFAAGFSKKLYEFRFCLSDGRKLWVEQSTKIIYDENDKIMEFRNVARDISERKAAEEALVESELGMHQLFNPDEKLAADQPVIESSTYVMSSLAKKISETNSKIREKLKQTITFASFVSHALRTPLTMIRFEMEDVLNNNAGKDGLELALKSSYEEILKMNHLVDDILNLATIEAGTFAIYKSKFELQKFLREFCDEICLLFKTKKQDFAFESGPEIIVEVDMLYFRQILFNLIDNAIKYTPAGGKISLSSCVENNSWSISIQDTGEGISSEQIEKIFSPFYVTHRFADKSSGIGLMIVKKITELHGGHISVDSIPNKGSTFTISFPLLPSS